MFSKLNERMARLIQIYLGLFLMSNVGVGWLKPLSELRLPPQAELFLSQLWQINLIMPAVKAIELVVALLLLFGKATPIALMLLYPVLFNILCISFHFFGSIAYSAGLLIGTLFLTWIHRQALLSIFEIGYRTGATSATD